jgi:uncharacterized protein YdhG (YjbR/CyaY superfamily)
MDPGSSSASNQIEDEKQIRNSRFCHFAPISFDVRIERKNKINLHQFKDKEIPMTQKKSTTPTEKTNNSFTDEELAAMKDHVQEQKRASRRSADKPDGESDVLAKIAEMPEPDRSMAERIHAIVKACAPELTPKTWYGMPAYARDGKVVCFFQSAHKFNYRYATLGFNEAAHLDEGAFWPVAYALKELTAADEEKIAALVKKAMS